MRVAVAGIWHETHTFSSIPTTMDDFVAYELLEGEEILVHHGGTRTGIGGILDGAVATGLEAVPVLSAGALPSGTVVGDAYGELGERLLDGLRKAGPLDAVLAPLHGAMVAEDAPDGEGRLLAEIRELVGDRPVVATLDYHANITPLMAEAADVLVGYDTYPHVDAHERGAEACRLVRRMLDGDLRPTAVLRKPPLMPAPEGQYTDSSPMREVLAAVHRMEGDERVATITVAGGFPYADIEWAGSAFLVTTDGDGGLAASLAEELASYAWEHREQFLVEKVPVEEAVGRARTAPAGPVVLVDAADNIGGGAPGDGTVILAELLAQDAEGVLVIADRESVAACWEAGEDGVVPLRVGGKTDRFHGDPVELTGQVVRLGDGRYRNRGRYMTGREVRMGRTAVIRAREVTVLLTERKTPPFDAEQLRSSGIEPAEQRAIAVKSAVAWRAAYGDVATEVIDVDTPGICTVRLERLPYSHVRRPIFPLDE